MVTRAERQRIGGILDGLDLCRSLVHVWHRRVHVSGGRRAVDIFGRRWVAHEFRARGFSYRDVDEQRERHAADDEHDPRPDVKVLPLADQNEQHNGGEALQQQHETVAKVVLQSNRHKHDTLVQTARASTRQWANKVVVVRVTHELDEADFALDHRLHGAVVAHGRNDHAEEPRPPHGVREDERDDRNAELQQRDRVARLTVLVQKAELVCALQVRHDDGGDGVCEAYALVVLIFTRRGFLGAGVRMSEDVKWQQDLTHGVS